MSVYTCFLSHIKDIQTYTFSSTSIYFSKWKRKEKNLLTNWKLLMIISYIHKNRVYVIAFLSYVQWNRKEFSWTKLNLLNLVWKMFVFLLFCFCICLLDRDIHILCLKGAQGVFHAPPFSFWVVLLVSFLLQSRLPAHSCDWSSHHCLHGQIPLGLLARKTFCKFHLNFYTMYFWTRKWYTINPLPVMFISMVSVNLVVNIPKILNGKFQI